MIPFNHPVAIQCNQQQMQQNQMQANNQQFPIQFHQQQQQQQQMFPMQATGQIQAPTMQQNAMQPTGMQMQQPSQQNVMHYQHIVQIQQQKKIPINIQVSFWDFFTKMGPRKRAWSPWTWTVDRPKKPCSVHWRRE